MTTLRALSQTEPLSRQIHYVKVRLVRPIVLITTYERLLTDLSARIADRMSARVRTLLSPINQRMEFILTKIDNLITATDNLSTQITEHRVIVDNAIALIREGATIEDPRLDALISQIEGSAASIDSASTDLAGAGAPADDEEPAEETPADPVEGELPEMPEDTPSTPA